MNWYWSSSEPTSNSHVLPEVSLSYNKVRYFWRIDGLLDLLFSMHLTLGHLTDTRPQLQRNQQVAGAHRIGSQKETQGGECASALNHAEIAASMMLMGLISRKTDKGAAERALP